MPQASEGVQTERARGAGLGTFAGVFTPSIGDDSPFLVVGAPGVDEWREGAWKRKSILR